MFYIPIRDKEKHNNHILLFINKNMDANIEKLKNLFNDEPVAVATETEQVIEVKEQTVILNKKIITENGKLLLKG